MNEWTREGGEDASERRAPGEVRSSRVERDSDSDEGEDSDRDEEEEMEKTGDGMQCRNKRRQQRKILE
jgi:hypothetical protein